MRRLFTSESVCGFDASICAVLTSIDEQSNDIDMGKNRGAV